MLTPDQIAKLPLELRKAWYSSKEERSLLMSNRALGNLCESLATWALQVVEERDDTQAKLTKARLGMEWRDDVISSFCDSINDKRLAEKRDEIQWREFDKANDFWEKEERGLELSPYKEQFLIQTDSYEQLENSIHGELDKLGVPRSGGSVIRIRDLHKRAETAEATIATLTRERERLKVIAAIANRSSDSLVHMKAIGVIDAALSHTPEGKI